MTAKEILVYTQPGCGDCEAAKLFLKSREVSFVEKNIRTDPQALDELKNKWQSRSTATVVIDGVPFAGFQANRSQIEKALSPR